MGGDVISMGLVIYYLLSYSIYTSSMEVTLSQEMLSTLVNYLLSINIIYINKKYFTFFYWK